MDFKEIQELLKLINRLDLSEFKMKDGGFELSIRTKNFEKSKGYGGLPGEAQGTMPQMVLPVSVPAAPEARATMPLVSVAAEAATPVEPGTDHLVAIRSPMVGTFYRSSSPDKPPFVKVGDKLSQGTVVCVVEAMKLFNEIESELSGTIEKILVEDAQPVEFDQVLFLINPKG